MIEWSDLKDRVADYQAFSGAFLLLMICANNRIAKTAPRASPMGSAAVSARKTGTDSKSSCLECCVFIQLCVKFFSRKKNSRSHLPNLPRFHRFVKKKPRRTAQIKDRVRKRLKDSFNPFLLRIPNGSAKRIKVDSDYRKSFRLKNQYSSGTVFIKQSLFVLTERICKTDIIR